MSSDLSSCQRDIDTIVHVASQLNVEKSCVMRFLRKKSSIKRLDIAQKKISHLIRGVGL